LKKDYVTNSVLTSYPWSSATTSDLDNFLSRILFLYRRVATSGDEELAKEQLRSQLREKVVVDRETVWSQMVSGRREQGIFRSVNQEIEVPSFEAKSAFGRRWPAWLTAKTCILLLALGVLVAIVQIQPFERVEESNCLAMLIFCTILWATEVSVTVTARDVMANAETT
jgi:phosphate transporter